MPGFMIATLSMLSMMLFARCSGGPPSNIGVKDGKLIWSATDPDGDKLSFILSLRRAGTEDVLFIIPDIETTHYPIEQLLSKTEDGQYVAKVSACDNFNEAQATSDAIVVKGGKVIGYGRQSERSGH